jgi:hypothetical protein
MKSKEDLKASLGKFTDNDKDTLHINKELIENLLDRGVVNEASLKGLENIIRSLNAIRDSHIGRYISLLRQGYMIEE